MFQLVGAGILALAVATSASASPAQAKTAKKAAAHSVTGTLEKYDASGNSIVVKTT
jgi:hypothetical protein